MFSNRSTVQMSDITKQYALSDRMMQPASYPDQYVRLVGLLDKAAESKPSWWRRFWTDKE